MLRLLFNPKRIDAEIEELLRLVERAEKKKPKGVKLKKKQAVGSG